MGLFDKFKKNENTSNRMKRTKDGFIEIKCETLINRNEPNGEGCIVSDKIKKEYTYITLRQMPGLKETAAKWFHDKWKVPQEAYLACMRAYLDGETEYGWKDLTPNVCAVYTEREYRNQGIAGRLLDIVVKDMKSKEISPIYLITDHTGFYERYGWEFLCMVQGDHDPEMTRMYIHR